MINVLVVLLIAVALIGGALYARSLPDDAPLDANGNRIEGERAPGAPPPPAANPWGIGLRGERALATVPPRLIGGLVFSPSLVAAPRTVAATGTVAMPDFVTRESGTAVVPSL
jgi:hypothetical protein